MGPTRIDKVAVYFAHGENMIHCHLTPESDLPSPGSIVELEHTCSIKPDGATAGKASYRVVSHKRLGEGWDGMDAVIHERDWLEAQYRRQHGDEDFFDCYSVAYDLDLPLNQSPTDNVIVEVEPVV